MSSVTISGNPSGSGTFTVQSPNSNTSRTITLPDATTTLVGTDATQTLTNKTIQGGALTLGTAVASTSGTAIDFTGIPSWVKRVTVMLNGVSTNATSPIIVQLGTGVGPTWTTTGYIGSVTTPAGSAQVDYSSGFQVSTANSATDTWYGHMTVNRFSSGNAYTESHGLVGGGKMEDGAGFVSLAAALTGVRITTVTGTGTFDAGTINIMYEG